MRIFSLLFVFFIFSTAIQAQSLVLKSGHVYDSSNKKLSNNEVKTLLESKPELLADYNSSKSKSAIGGFLLGFGLGAMIGDLVGGLTADVQYPTAFTIVGVASTLISIPVLIGREKKMKRAINGYNESLSNNKSAFQVEKINLMSNKNGIGLVVSF